jgi:hypothetical protein
MWAAMIPALMQMMQSQGGQGGQKGGMGGMPNGTPGGWGDLAQQYFGKAGGWIADPIGRLMGGGQNDWKNPADAAKPYLDQISGTITPYYQPYINAGQNAMGQLMPQYNRLVNDPTSVQNQIGSTFKASPGYGWNVDQATNAANRASAAGGMMGTPQEQQQLATTVSGLANQDYYNYVNQGLGMYNQGLSGLGNINQMGYGASTGLANNLASALMSQAQLAYTGQQNANQQGGGFNFASLF